MKRASDSSSASQPACLKVTEPVELLKYLLASFPNNSRSCAKGWLAHHQVFVNGSMVSQFNYLLKAGDGVQIGGGKIATAKPLKQHDYFSIVFEDDYLIVVDKRAGILTMASADEKIHTVYHGLSQYMKSKHPRGKIFIVHRLDRDTSGLVVFAKSEKVQQLFQEDWKQVVTHRVYVAITEGVVLKNEGVVESFLYESKSLVVHSGTNPEKGKQAVTNYKVIRRSEDFTMLELQLDTGRKNQIRVHMQDLGHCVVGDKKYGAKGNPLGRLGLHAKRLAFVHPVTHQSMNFQSPTPKKFLHLFCKGHQ